LPRADQPAFSGKENQSFTRRQTSYKDVFAGKIVRRQAGILDFTSAAFLFAGRAGFPTQRLRSRAIALSSGALMSHALTSGSRDRWESRQCKMEVSNG
jgi:hypothetical protein